MRIIVFFLSCLTLTSCGSAVSTSESREKVAYSLATRACNLSEKLSQQERANLAAQANSLDAKWERLADASNYAAALENVSELQKELPNLKSYTDQLIDYLYQFNLNSVKFKAECSLLTLKTAENG